MCEEAETMLERYIESVNHRLLQIDSTNYRYNDLRESKRSLESFYMKNDMESFSNCCDFTQQYAINVHAHKSHKIKILKHIINIHQLASFRKSVKQPLVFMVIVVTDVEVTFVKKIVKRR